MKIEDLVVVRKVFGGVFSWDGIIFYFCCFVWIGSFEG